MTILSLTKNRKDLVDAITGITGRKMIYQGPPTFVYTNGTFSVQRDGSLEVDNIIENVGALKELAAQGLIDDSWDEDRQMLSITLPIRSHTPLSLTHLLQIMWGKEELINKAVGTKVGFKISDDFIDHLEKEPPTSIDEFLSFWDESGKEEATKGIAFDGEKIYFTGFPYTEDPEWVKTYMDLACAINDEALVSKRVKVAKPEAPNEKYYFRVWLVRVGLGGTDHKISRKLLLSNLSGNSAFRTQEQMDEHRKRHEGKKHDCD